MGQDVTMYFFRIRLSISLILRFRVWVRKYHWKGLLGQPLPTDLQETVGIYSKFKYELKLLKAKHDKIMLSTAN